MVDTLTKGYAEIGWAGMVMIAMLWYFYYQTKCQTKREDKHDAIQAEERLFYRDLVKSDLKELHQDSLKNASLNKKSIVLQKSIANQTIGALNIICDRLNGENSEISKAKNKLKEKVNSEK